MKTRLLLAAILALAATSALAAPRRAVLQLSQSSITINAPFGGPNPAPTIVVLSNTSGGGKLKWDASDNRPWLFVSPTSGELRPNESTDLSISVDVAGLAAGPYSGTVTVQDRNGGSPVTLTVDLVVSAVARITLSPSPGPLTFTAPQSGPNPANKIMTVQNTGGAAMNYTVTYTPTSWLSGNVSGGTLLPGATRDITISVNVASLGLGTHSGSVKIDSAEASNSPQTLSVSLTVTASPVIGLTPTTLTFDAAQGGSAPPAKNVSLSNQGGQSMSWSAATNAAWLSVSPTTGPTLTGSATQTLTVTVNPAGLAEGTYVGAVTVTAPSATNTPRAVNVTLNINVVPKIGVNPTSVSFTAAEDGGALSPSALSVSNTGSGTLNWTASSADGWVGIQPSNGQLTALASQPLLLSVSAAGKPPGIYTTTIQIADPAASNSPVTVAVDLTVTPSDLPSNAPAGQCGLLGAELLILLLIRRRGGMPWRSR